VFASGKDSKAAEDATAEGADHEPEEEVQEPMSDGEQTTQDTPIGELLMTSYHSASHHVV